MLAPLRHTWNSTSQVCRIQLHHKWSLFVPREHVCSGPIPIIPLGHLRAWRSWEGSTTMQTHTLLYFFWLECRSSFLSRRSLASASNLTQLLLGLPWGNSIPGKGSAPKKLRWGTEVRPASQNIFLREIVVSLASRDQDGGPSNSTIDIYDLRSHGKIGDCEQSTQIPYPIYDQNLQYSLLYLLPDHIWTCFRRAL